MKNVKGFLIVIISLGIGAPLWAQFPFYDIEVTQVCYDSVGTRTTLNKVDLYVLGRDDIGKSIYFDRDGNTVVPADSLLLDGPCFEAVTDTIARVVTFEDAINLADYNISEDTYDIVSIVYLGYGTGLLFVQGQSMRMLSGESYRFVSSFDEQQRRVLRNPAIVISQGTAVEDYWRVYMERK